VNDNQIYDGSGEYFQLVNFPNGVIIDSIEGDGGGTDNMNITFVPPRPTTNINDILLNYNEAGIVLKDNRNNITRNIEINYFGLIDVQKN
jgi:hypothetical protein